MRQQVAYGVTYWPADVGPFMWHEFNVERVRDDLQAVSRTGHRIVRVALGWDAFMPSPATVNPSRLRDLERFLAAADAASLQVVPVLFVHTLGDALMLPAFAIDVDRPRRGVRVLTDGVVQPGGPRDLYTDRLMLDAAVLWSETLASAFAGHAALAWWDLAHDPASSVRPRHIPNLNTWLRTVGQPLRDAGDRCGVSLGTGDIVTARGVRPAVAAEAVDVFALELDLRQATMLSDVAAVRRTVFLAQLAMRLSDAPAMHAQVAWCEQEPDDADGAGACMTAADARRFGADVVAALAEHGCDGVHAAQWTEPGSRIVSSAPFDRAYNLVHRGVVTASGNLTSFGESWTQQLARERDVQQGAAWPSHIDVDSYYANLPESLLDLYAAWGEVQDDPAMLQ